MERADEHHVYFAVFDFGDDPAAVTRAMGVEPTHAWVRGQRTAGAGPGRRTHSRWALQSRLPVAATAAEHLGDLLPRLELRRDAVRDVCRRFTAHVGIAAYYRVTWNPGLHLPADVVGRVAGLGLGIDLDLYCFAAPDEAGRPSPDAPGSGPG